MRDERHFADRVFQGLAPEVLRFQGIEYLDCRFERCSLSGADFRDCRFVGCSFTACDLGLTTWENCSFSGVEFEKCKAIGIDWTVARWPMVPMPDAIALRDSAINHSTFLGLNLPGLQVTDCVARGVDFREADLTGADFSGTDLEGTLFSSTNLSGADLSRARNYRLSPAENRLRRTKFSMPEATSLLYCMEFEIVE